MISSVSTSIDGIVAAVSPLRDMALSAVGFDWIRPLDSLIRMFALICAILIAGMMLRARRDPLASAPTRLHRLTAETLILAVMVYLAAAVLANDVLLRTFGADRSLHAEVLASVIAQTLGMTTCLIVAAKRFDGGLSAFLIGRNQSMSVITTLIVSVFITILAVGLCEIVYTCTVLTARWFDPSYSESTHRTLLALREGSLPTWGVLSLWIGAVVLAPIGEEVFFRGMFQSILVDALSNRWRAIAISSLLFSLAHLSQPETVPPLFVLGVILGVIYERTGCLLPCILIHAMFNSRTMILEALGLPTPL